MSTFVCTMRKPGFLGMIKKVLEGDPRPGHVNETLGLRLSDFDGWDEWFNYGEHNADQTEEIRCSVKNVKAIQFLKDHGFVEEREA